MTPVERMAVVQAARLVYESACRPLYMKRAGIGASFYDAEEWQMALRQVARPGAMAVLQAAGLTYEQACQMIYEWSCDIGECVEKEKREFLAWEAEQKGEK